MKICPKCRRRCIGEQCDSCHIVFAEYQQKKMGETAQVYRLISAGELEQAKELAKELAEEFPDSKGDFLLLISNINRDINIAGKYQQAHELFRKGDYDGTALLLRNIKAFDPGLEEKVIALRRKAKRYSDNDWKLKQADEHLEKKQYSEARSLLHQIHDQKHKEDVKKRLAKLDEVKSDLLQEVAGYLGKNLFDTARRLLDDLIRLFPETEQEQAGLFLLLAQRKTISDTLTAVARKAREEGRLLEAKVIYAFLLWQNEELRPLLLPYLKEIGPQAVVTLADCQEAGIIDFSLLNVQVDESGFLKPVLTERELTSKNHVGEHLPNIVPVLINPAPQADAPNEPVDIDGEEVADFA